MALPTSGQICFSQLQSEFGGSNPICLSEYYRNGSYVDGTRTVSSGRGEVFFLPPFAGVGGQLWYQIKDGTKWRVELAWWNFPVYPELIGFYTKEFPLSQGYLVITGAIYSTPPTSITLNLTNGKRLIYYRGTKQDYTSFLSPTGEYYAVGINYDGVDYPSGGGTSTENINTGVPTSGQICLSNFRGAEAA